MDWRDVPILVGTLGKALGTFGAFVAGAEDLIEYLTQKARTYIYTTAPPPAVAEATRVSLSIARKEDWRRARLEELVERFRGAVRAIGLPLQESRTPIQPVLAGTARRALVWARRLRREGILVTPIRPPTVPEGSARLRITLSAVHTDQQLARLLHSLRLLREEEPA
jgi:8-amino-7-oxononanoate synthase